MFATLSSMKRVISVLDLFFWVVSAVRLQPFGNMGVSSFAGRERSCWNSSMDTSFSYLRAGDYQLYSNHSTQPHTSYSDQNNIACWSLWQKNKKTISNLQELKSSKQSLQNL